MVAKKTFLKLCSKLSASRGLRGRQIKERNLRHSSAYSRYRSKGVGVVASTSCHLELTTNGQGIMGNYEKSLLENGEKMTALDWI